MQVKNSDYWLMNGNCLDHFHKIPDNSIHLTVTSPPYDNLRKYNGSVAWNENVWKQILKQLYRVTCKGGVVVWVVGDATINKSETGTSFKQALFAMECGFKLHDTMIYHKNSLPKNHNRYEQDFEYMFVFSKGKPRVFNPIRIPTKFPEKEGARKNSFFSVTDEKMRSARSGKQRKPVGTIKIKGNIWYYPVGKGHSTSDAEAFKHPAIFPEKLVHDHIISWSDPHDIVFDPFTGSGTTGKMALLNLRRFVGFELSRDYYFIARNRLANVHRDLPLIRELHDQLVAAPKGKANRKSLAQLTTGNLLWAIQNKPERLAKLLDKETAQTLHSSKHVDARLIKTYLKYNATVPKIKQYLAA